METSSAKAQQLIAQSKEWTFAGDCALMKWMEEIGNNLQQRATNTNQSFAQLNTNLKRTTTALDNATNSIAALQYTQFVENRVHDDDETIANVAEVPVDIVNNNEQKPDKSELWKKFMQRSIEVLHRTHDRYEIEGDNEDEDGKSYIYQPKNPYEKRALPHIYGSKLWHENWHVGLLPDNTPKPSDAASLAASVRSASNSSSSHVDVESNDSTPAKLSNSNSASSLSNDKQRSATPQTMPLPQQLQNAETLPNPHASVATAAVVAATAATESDNSSVTSKKVRPTVRNVEPRFDLFAPIQDTPPAPSTGTPSSTSSSTTSDFRGSGSARVIHKSNESLASLTAATTVADQLIAPAATTLPQPSSSQIRRRPVNLFDDDDFNSFLTEIVDKVNNKPDALTTATLDENSNAEALPKVAPNLFDAHIETVATLEKENVSKTSKATPRIAANLFEENFTASPLEEKDDNDDDIFRQPKIGTTKKVPAKTLATSLFDDDEDDDDFLNIFASKKRNIPSKSLIFADDKDDNVEHTDESKEQHSLFNKTPQTVTNLITRKYDLFKDADDAVTHDLKQEQSIHKVVSQNKLPKLFISDDEDNDDVAFDVNFNKDAANKTAASAIAKEPSIDIFAKTSVPLAAKPLVLPKKHLKLFDDDFSDGEDILQSAKKQLSDIAATKIDVLAAGDNNNDVIQSKNDEELFATVDENVLKSKIDKTVDGDKKNTDLTLSKPTELQAEATITIEDEDKSTESPKAAAFTGKVDKEQQHIIAIQPTTADIVEQIAAEAPEQHQNLENTANETLETTEAKDNYTTQSLNASAAQSIVNNYASLFLDEPPEDDNAFFQTLDSNALANAKFDAVLEQDDFFEPVLTQLATDVAATSSSAYSGLGLFSEIPPDDDDADENVEDNNEDDGAKANTASQRIHSIFYDDFMETMAAVDQQTQAEAVAAAKTTNLHAIFNDEPPPDDDFVESLFASQPKKLDKPNEKKETKHVAEIKNIETMRTQKAAVVSKLQMPKFNINVQALLPQAAARPQLSKTSNAEQAQTLQTAPSVISNENISTVEPATTHTNASILVSVCKHRVRAPAKRRPSTRRGRQENYRKSLLAAENTDDATLDENEDGHVGNTLKTTQKSNEMPNIPTAAGSKETKELFKEPEIIVAEVVAAPQTAAHNIKQQNTNLLSNVAANAKQNLSSNVVPIKATAAVNKNPVASTTNASIDLFNDSEEDDDDFLFSKTKKTLTSTTVAAPTAQVFDAVSAVTTTAAVQSKAAVKHKDALFEATPAQQTVKKQIPQKVSLFGDSTESDSDELFADKKQAIPKQVVPIKNTSTQPSQQPKSSKLQTPGKQPPLSVAKNTTSLFGSDNEDDDGNDNNDDDAFMKSMSKNSSFKASGKADNKALFSDSDDDDDDLFASSTKKVPITEPKGLKNPNKTTAGHNKQPNVVTTTTTPKSTATTADNPLADLLNL